MNQCSLIELLGQASGSEAGGIFWEVSAGWGPGGAQGGDGRGRWATSVQSRPARLGVAG